MYTMSSGKNEKIINVLEKYRTTSSINFSDIVEDRTIYDQTRTEATFDPAQEISGRLSTWENDQSTMEPDINPDAVSVDDILCNSIVQEIRHLHQSRASTSIRNSMPFGLSTSQFPLRSDDISCASADFRPAEEVNMNEFLSLQFTIIFNLKTKQTNGILFNSKKTTELFVVPMKSSFYSNRCMNS